ncbi:hypothetical protein [Nocardioides cynanchi]|uniref:hypothetical protein n=1 Tax=Nocardioides cynanchi TaxID=2558918 RepID=UPI001248E0A6|nr:hypothetical protein [Nocardioides cynanchi]
MTLTSRATAVAAGALALALTGPGLSAHAAGTNWKSLVTFEGAKIQACKVPTTATGPWKVKLRIDATKATTRVQGAGYVMKGNKTTDSWKSAWVTRGHYSGVGTVKLPRGAQYTLNAGLGGGQSGDGGSFVAKQVPHC